MGLADTGPTWVLGTTQLKASSPEAGSHAGMLPHWTPAFGMLQPSVAWHMGAGLLPFLHSESSEQRRITAYGDIGWEVPLG